MSQTETKMPLAKAQSLAAFLIEELRPTCARIEVAGSVRRGKPDVGDIEIVAIPKASSNLFGEPAGQSLLDLTISEWVLRGRVERLKNGDKFKQLYLIKPQCKLDLFLCSPETWGCVFVIRTGSAEFSRRMVTKKSHGGLCPDDLAFRDGRLWPVYGDAAIETPEEMDVFQALGLAWLEPRKRT